VGLLAGAAVCGLTAPARGILHPACGHGGGTVAICSSAHLPTCRIRADKTEGKTAENSFVDLGCGCGLAYARSVLTE